MKINDEYKTETYVGYGIHVINASGANRESLKTVLFKTDVYSKSSNFLITKANESVVVSNVTNRSQNIFTSDKFSTKIKTEKAVAFFSGEIEAKYNKNSTLSKSTKSFNAIKSMETEQHAIISRYKAASDMKEIIEQNVLAKINDIKVSPTELFDDYGTHIIVNASIGGSILISGSYNSTNQIGDKAFETLLEAACKYASANFNANLTSEKEQIIDSTEIDVLSYGGNPSIMAGIHRLDELERSFKSWAESVLSKDSQVLSKVYEYMPIWKLANSKDRSTQIEEVFCKLVEERYNKVAKYFTLPERKQVALRVLPFRSKIERQKIAGGIRIASSCYEQRGTLGVDSGNLFCERYVKMLGWAINSENTFIMYTNDDDNGTVSFFSKSEQKFLTVHVNSVFDKRNLVRSAIHQLYLISDNIGDHEKFELEKCNNNLYKIKSTYSKKYIKCMDAPGAKKAKGFIIFTANADFDDAREFELVDIPKINRSV